MSTALLLVFMAAFGLAIGSFLNVVIVRVPSGESIWSPPSKCPMCESPIATRDNIPILSWVLLKGKCRSCAAPIPAGYPLVEATNMVLWVLVGIRFGASVELIPYAILFSVLLALSVIDLELYILPNVITYPSIIVSLVAVPALSLAFGDDPGRLIKNAFIGGFGYAAFLLVLLLLFELVMRKEGMGMGDVKLAVILGLWLGWLDPLLVLVALIAASVIGLVVGVGMLVVRKGESKPFPFGPWLALGAILVILFSGPILRFYGFDDDVSVAQAVVTSTSFGALAGQ